MRPILFEAWGLRAASAPVFAGLAALLAYAYFEFRKKDLGLSEEKFWGLIAALAIGVFAGSIGGYALISRGGNWNWALWTGRFAIPGGTFLGALPGAVVMTILYCKVMKIPIGPPADVLAGAAPLGLIVMRIGCLLNGCCHGLATGGSWGIVFTGWCATAPALRGVPLHPTQLYEAGGALLIFLVVERYARPRIQAKRMPAGDAMWISALLYSVLRFVVDFVRAQDPSVVVVLLWPHLSLVQWACAATAAVCVGRFALGRGRA